MAEPTFDQFRDSLQAVELSAIEPQVADVVREVRGRGSQSKIDFYDRMTELLGSWYGVGPWIGAWYSLYCNELEGKHDDLPENAFYMVGTIDDAIAKAKAMRVE